MRKNSNEFNKIGNTRYSINVRYNERNYTWNESSEGPIWKLEMYFTYTQLIKELNKQLLCDSKNDDTNSLQQYRNHHSTLNSFLTYLGKTEDSRIGLELKSGFDGALNEYLQNINVSDRTKSDRRSHLKRWVAIFEQLSNTNKEANKPAPKQFNLALRKALLDAGITQAELIAKANISKSVLAHWLKGATPNKLSLSSIHRVETALALTRNSLTDLLNNSTDINVTIPRKIEFRERLAELTKLPYKLQESALSPEFLNEWWKFFNYKTSEYSDLARTKRGVWRLKALEKNGSISHYACIGKEGSATASIAWEKLINFFGFLALEVSKGGLGITNGNQSLAWLAHPVAINEFLNFLKKRSGGLRHNSHLTFSSLVISVTNEKTGYLWQQPEFMKRIPNHLLPKNTSDWLEMCAKANEVARTWKSVSFEKSRVPEEPIAPLLALPYPLQPVLRAIKQLDSEAAAMPSGGVVQARLKRDALLLAFLVTNPLRILNFKIIKWHGDGSQHLYKTTGKQFRLRFAGSEMKTRKPYDVKVSAWLVNRLEEYIDEYRDVLLGGKKSDYLFLSSNTKLQTKWNSMDSQISKLTRRLIPETLGFGPHAFRHLVATDWLRKHPNDYITVAALLNDKLETVIKNYAHLKLDDSFDRYESYLTTTIDINSN